MDKFKDWKDLSFRLNRYATGDYIKKCTSCEDVYLGDKRSSLCLECDLIEVKKELESQKKYSKYQRTIDVGVINNAIYCLRNDDSFSDDDIDALIVDLNLLKNRLLNPNRPQKPNELNIKLKKLSKVIHKESQDDSIPINEKIGVKILKSAGILTNDNKLSDKYEHLINLLDWK